MTCAAEHLTEGAWRARWGAWEIRIRGDRGRWETRIVSCVRGQGRVQIARRNVFATAADAVTWACETLAAHGAQCFVDGREQDLAHFLAFEPTLGVLQP